MPLPLSAASTIASYAIRPADPKPSFFSIELSQAEHRIRLINAWGDAIRPGTRILELGCGQGTCTQALAEAIRPPPASSETGTAASEGETKGGGGGGGGGHIDAVDPGAPDYGSPFTLGQAQAHLSAGPVGSLITWHRAEPVAFLAAHPGRTWDVAVLAHCVWYFASPGELGRILAALRGRVARVLIAEWALRATEPSAAAHVLAVLARGAFEAHRVGSCQNVQTPLSPAAIRRAAEEAGWAVEGETVVVPEKELADGYWETAMVVGEGFVQDVEREIGDERVKALLKSARDATIAAADAVGGAKGVRSMDVWVATLVPGE
ncbi:uncharacterized protein THITE_2084027 [Thermothielavioides terrestris NRRL 8126]|uniref:Methyltransferase domain-containing protein n=1 Tax=Thermothielavioides terrestris (strain ATCC 38088 / NRRL 8126) TaxID=578455 RepID=G2QRG6_THETT|nr:uncharacterized protein THITE_2084027 [Thermothielavioides terrestris NRRL 8126]AEO62511.1 hypothetical protein THITE_2084027 [Thermothielavioides terrestris NRRL 8126]